VCIYVFVYVCVYMYVEGLVVTSHCVCSQEEVRMVY
jgi:hypothetical protein